MKILLQPTGDAPENNASSKAWFPAVPRPPCRNLFDARGNREKIERYETGGHRMVGLCQGSAQQVKLPSHVVDLAADELRSCSGDHIDLRPRSYAVLRLLAENAGRLVCKDDIITKVWDDVAVTEDSLTQCITDIRKAIGDEDKRVLRTVPRKGYILVPSQRRVQLTPREQGQPSLAVMPFLSIGSEDALGIGMATEIINELARNRDIRLIARDSSFVLAGQKIMAEEIGERLGVRYLVEGSVQLSDGTIIVDVQLIDARDGSIAWGDRFAGAAKNVPRVRHEIAGTIAGSLHSGIREAVKQEILGRAPKDLDVFALTLRGIAHKHQFNPEATRAGRTDLEEAIRRDPSYAPAHTYLAWLNLIDMLNQFTGEWQFPQLGDVVAQFNRSIQLDPNFPQAYSGLSHALIHTGDIAQALAAARRGAELGPSDADGRLFLGLALFESSALKEALDAVERAVALNPLKPPHYCFFHAMVLWGNERYKEALDELDECLRKTPSFGGAATYRLITLVALKRLDEAKAQLAQCIARPGGIVIVPPHPPELASRALAALQAAGWRPSVAASRKAV